MSSVVCCNLLCVGDGENAQLVSAWQGAYCTGCRSDLVMIECVRCQISFLRTEDHVFFYDESCGDEVCEQCFGALENASAPESDDSTTSVCCNKYCKFDPDDIQICEKCGVAKPEKFDAPDTHICRDCIHAFFYESADEEPEAPPPKKARSPVHADQVAVLPPAPAREVIDLTKPSRIRITIDLTSNYMITSFDV